MKVLKVEDYIVVVSDDGKILDVKNVSSFVDFKPVWIDPNCVPGLTPKCPDPWYWTWTTTSVGSGSSDGITSKGDVTYTDGELKIDGGDSHNAVNRSVSWDELMEIFHARAQECLNKDDDA